MQLRRGTRVVFTALVASMLSAATLVAMALTPVTPQALADDDEPPSTSEYEQKLKHQEELKKQLAGVDEDLVKLVLKLDDLTERQIPEAERALDIARQQVVRAEGLVQSTTARLQAAQRDKTNLEQQIASSGKDYDQAQQTVARLARESFHTGGASEVLSVITKAKTTNDFVNQLQAKAAVVRSEAMLANHSALLFSTAQNRHDRVQAIERQIAQLKSEADLQAATAKQANANARRKSLALSKLREEGEKDRKALESKKSQIKTESAREAVEIIQLKSKIDAYNKMLEERKKEADLHAAGQQQLPPSQVQNPGQPVQPIVSTPAPGQQNGNPQQPQGMDYNPFGNCYEGMAYCYGHPTGNTVGGNAYPWSECTWYAYHRRVDYYHLPAGSFMGNGRDWANTGRALGYLVNRIPHQGAAVVFQPGQAGAVPYYGHVAIVERVNSDGSILISECSSWQHGRVSYRTVYNASAYEYVHY